MGDSSDSLYEGREQTEVKHLILRNYLERFAHKIGSTWDVITYVDCFSGPWQSQSARLEDTSFAIALRELRRARDTYLERNRSIGLRCLFLERDRDAFGKLQEYASHQTDVNIRTVNAEFEDAIPEIVDFSRRSKSFPFFFVDPKGWSGIYIKTLAPLLRLEPSEFLINFMADPIIRFLNSPQEATRQSYRDLFGSDRAHERLRELHGQDLKDAAIAEYSNAVRRIGGFQYLCSTPILYPATNKIYFNLLYATRHPAGAQVFKEVERKSFPVSRERRAQALSQRRTKATRNLPLFLPEEAHLDSLRKRYLEAARQTILRRLQESGRLAYDDAWYAILHFPLVWESDLKAWIREWKGKSLELRLGPNQRVPALGKGNLLIWKPPRT